MTDPHETVTAPEEAPVREADEWPAWLKPTVAGLLSLALFLAFLLLRLTPSKLGAASFPIFTAVLSQEFNFWLGHTLLVVPASALAVYALEKPLVAFLRTVYGAVERASSRDLWLSLVFFVALFAALAAVARDVVLDGISVVDDEEVVRFGGRILASGHVYVDDTAGLLRHTFELFLFWDGTRVASLDFLGIQVAHALAEKTGLGSGLFAAAAALALAGVAVAAYMRLGRRGALVATLLLASSPMFVALSLTEHAHLVSRTFIALSFAFFALVFARGGSRLGVGLGFVLGCAFVTRPPETTALLTPMVVLFVARAARSRPTRLAVAGAMGGALLPLAAMLLHNHALTGSAFRFARMDLIRSVVIVPRTADFLVRYGNQIGHNGMLLVLFSFGLVGALLAALGVFFDAFTVAAAAGVALVFAMGLIHVDYGVHIVGPIHQSECVIPLCLLATHGAFRLRGKLGGASLSRIVALGGGTIGLASAIFLSVQLSAMRAITRAHYETTHFLREATEPTEASKVVVIAPSYLRVMHSMPELAKAGSWFNGWPRPRPDLEDDLIVLTVEPDPSPLTISRVDLPLSAEAAHAAPIPNVPIGVAERQDHAWLAREESALAGRIRQRFPERRIFKLVMDDKTMSAVAVR